MNRPLIGTATSQAGAQSPDPEKGAGRQVLQAHHGRRAFLHTAKRERHKPSPVPIWYK